ncbi:MAG: hypothetical protein IT335_16175 [Thermomicrobiales bacterium]|nr:hypothetical protein [Thermomicrobiales bacterium]
MGTALKARRTRGAANLVPWESIPPTLRILYVAGRQRTGSWLAEAFAADSASEILLDQVLGSSAGLARLRDEVFDALLVSHEPDELDALTLVEGYRAGGADEPIVVLGNQSEQEMAVLAYEVGADGYVCVNTTTTRNLIWVVVRAVQRHELIRENRRLNQGERNRLQREREEAQRLLDQQRTLIDAHEPFRPGGPPDDAGPPPDLTLPPELVCHYRELLRAYVIMGSGNLAKELGRLGELLVAAQVTARQAMHLHVHALGELIHGLGTRSTRHVMQRADLLAIEIMVRIAEGYRRRHQRRLHPPVQRLLPGMDPLGRTAP